MLEIKGSLEILSPAEDVFAYATDPKKSVEWESAVVEMEQTSEGPLGVGSKGRRVEKTIGTDEYTWEVTEYEAGKTFTVNYDSQNFAGGGGFDLEAIEGGTRLAYRFRGNAKRTLFRLLAPLMMPIFRRQTKKDFNKLKEILESKE